ncbi:unnamed protein product [Arctogadus glacialis]
MGLPRSVRRVKPAVADIPLDVHLLFLLGLWGPGLTGSYMDQPTSSCWPETVVDHKNSCWPEPSVDHLNRCCPELSLDYPKGSRPETSSSCPETSVDHTKGSCCPETIVDHPKGSSSSEPIVVQPCSLPVSHTPSVSEAQRKAPVDSTDSGKGTASIPTTSYCVATETEEVKEALADIPLDVTSKNEKQKQGRVKSPPETSVDHPKGSSSPDRNVDHPKGSSCLETNLDHPKSSCPETSVDHPKSSCLETNFDHPKGSSCPETSVDHTKGSCCPETSVDHPKGSSPPETNVDHPKGSSPPETSVDHPKGSSPPETSVDNPKGSSFPELTRVQPYSSCPEPIVDQPCSLPVSHTPSVSEAQRKASVDTTDSGKGTASIPTASYGVATETVEVKPAVADPLDVTQKNKETQGRVKRETLSPVWTSLTAAALSPQWSSPTGETLSPVWTSLTAALQQPYSSCKAAVTLWSSPKAAAALRLVWITQKAAAETLEVRPAVADIPLDVTPKKKKQKHEE